jgi:dolichyl-phosphate-mannose-protein mannosyltransferase
MKPVVNETAAPNQEAGSEPAAPHSRVLVLLSLALFVFSLTFQMWSFEEFPPYPYFDEVYTVTSAQEGFEDPDKLETTHPPLAPYIIKLSILLWGDSPAAWRLPSRIFGGLTVVLVLLISAHLSRKLLPSVIAAILLLSDGVFITATRAALYEGQVIFFSFAALTAAIYACAPGRSRRSQTALIVASALLLGLALATKWSAVLFVPCIIYLLVIALPLRRAIFHSLMLVSIVMAAYVAVCCALTSQAPHELLRANLALFDAHMNPAAHHRYESSGWTWPFLIRPIWFGFSPEGANARGTICLGNPIVFLVALLSIITLSIAGIRQAITNRSRSLAMRALPVVGFFATWLPWCLLTKRKGFLYYYLPSLIFGCIACATALSLVPAHHKGLRLLLIGCALLAVPVGVLYLPVYLGIEVPFDWMTTLLPFTAWW